MPIATAHALPHGDNDIELTPMLDVVFIMLIFFVVTASFTKEFGIDLNPPDSSTPWRDDVNSIYIVISKNNEIWLDNRNIDHRAIRPNIARMHAGNPDASLVIQADKRSSNKSLVTVMDASRAVGIYDIALARNND